MKKYLFLYLTCLTVNLNAQSADADTLGLPGDDLDLYAVLDLFKASSSVENFEKSLNDEKTGVNNLDLNNDGNVDYISVRDTQGEDSHTLVLRIAIDGSESQDVACIALEKTGADMVVVQAIGDEDLYGKDYFIEPSDEGMKEGGKGSFGGMPVHVNVWFWPCVRYVYAPGYVVWVSPWYWNYYPHWWRPWGHMGWNYYHPHVMHYHTHYVHVHSCHVPRAYHSYNAHRVRSTALAGRSGQHNSGGRSNQDVGRQHNGRNKQVRPNDNSPNMNGREKSQPGNRKSSGSIEKQSGKQQGAGNKGKTSTGGKSRRK